MFNLEEEQNKVVIKGKTYQLSDLVRVEWSGQDGYLSSTDDEEIDTIGYIAAKEIWITTSDGVEHYIEDCSTATDTDMEVINQFVDPM